MEIREVEPWLWEAESETSDNTYNVWVDPRLAQGCKCSCTWWAVKRNKDKKYGEQSVPYGRPPQLGNCKHVDFVLHHLENIGQTPVEAPDVSTVDDALAEMRRTVKEFS